MRKSTFWISFLFVVASFIIPSVARGVTVSIDPAEQIVSEVGETITVNVKISGVTNLFGFQFDLTFDPVALQATAVKEGDFLKSDGEDTFWNKPAIDNDAGTITNALCARLSGVGIDGDGVLATITLKALEVKESKIELQNVKLSDFDVKPIKVNVISLSKIVVGEVTTFNIGLAVGINLISVPLKPKEEWRLSDLADFIGKETVTLIIWYDKSSGKFVSYMPIFPETSPTNTSIKKGEGYIVLMKAEKSVTFKGTPWKGDVSLQSGINLLSVPLDSGDVWRLSNMADFIGKESVTLIIWYDKSSGKFVSYMPTFPDTSPTNAVIKGGEGYIVVMKADRSVTFAGKAWSNAVAGAPPIMPVTPKPGLMRTPVLTVEGVVREENTGLTLDGLRVRVANLESKQDATDITGAVADSGRYVVTFADLATNRAAQVGDVIKVNVTDSNGIFAAESIRYRLKLSDVEAGKVSLDDILLSPIPKENALLQNFPNPFNPETWIPYQLTKPAEVTIKIYSATGQLVRTLDFGKKEAGVYHSRDCAAYWDGRNDFGERVASGIYYYSIQAGTFSATRKLAILK